MRRASLGFRGGQAAYQLPDHVVAHVAEQHGLFALLGQGQRFVVADVALLQQFGVGDPFLALLAA